MSHAAGAAGPYPGYIRPIDGLRAIAVLAVMLYHLRPSWLPGGFAGVDVFFVISGYVVSASLHREAGRGFAGFLAGFYARRLLRLLPALLACLLATSLLATLFIPDAWLSKTSEKTALHAFFGLSNFALAGADDYFSPRTEYNPYAHTWSLGVEEQFYLLFPLLLYAWARWRDREGARRALGRALLPLALLASWAFAVQAHGRDPQSAFYLLPSRFWELAAGALLFQWMATANRRADIGRWARHAVAPGLALVLAGLAFAGPEAFPLRWGPLLIAGTVLVLLGVAYSTDASNDGAMKATASSRFLASPPMAYLGRISYSLYLWHWPVFVLMRWTVGLEGPALAALALALAFSLAMLSFHALEQPLRQSARLRRWPKPLLIAAAIATAIAGWKLAERVFAHQGQISLSVTRDTRTWQPNPRHWPPGVIEENCRVEIQRRDADRSFGQRYQPVGCERPPETPRQLFAIGDSHAMSYAPLFYRLAAERGVRVHIHAKTACTFAKLDRPQSGKSQECADFIEGALSDIHARAKPGDIVFMASLRVERFATQAELIDTAALVAAENTAEAKGHRREALRETAHLLERFRGSGVRLMIDAPKPVFRRSLFRCSDWFNEMNPLCGPAAVSRAELQPLTAPALDAIGRLQAAHPGLVAWDPFPVLCPGDPCLPYDAQGPLFFDGDHLSAHGNHVLYPSFLAQLDAIWANEPQAR